MKLLKFLFPDQTWYEQDNYKIDCLWCNHTALEISSAPPHQFQCWHCKTTGNAFTLINKYYSELPKFTINDLKEITTKKKGIKAHVLFQCGIRSSSHGLVWPVKNTSGGVVSLYRFSEKHNTFFSTPKPCALSIIGLESYKAEVPVWITEGHWDYAAFLSHADLTGLTVLGLCGSSWPSNKLNLLESREIIFLADNDDAGKKGVQSLAIRMKKMGSLPSSLKFINWNNVSLPSIDPLPDKFDIRDLCVELYHGT